MIRKGTASKIAEAIESKNANLNIIFRVCLYSHKVAPASGMRRFEIVKSVSIVKRKSVVMASCARDIFAPRRFVVFTSSFAHVFLTLKRLTMLLSFLCPLSDSGADTIRLYLLRRKALNERTNQNLILKSLNMFVHKFCYFVFLIPQEIMFAAVPD